MTLPESTAYLRRYQAWRRGDDERPFNDTGLTPEGVGDAIDTMLNSIALLNKEINAGRSRLAKCQVQREQFHSQLRSKKNVT